MSNTATKVSSNFAVVPVDFINGREYRHQNGEVVLFKDDKWCIQPSTGRRITASFNGLPKWLKRPAKLTIAQGWQILGRSPNWCAGYLSTYRRIGEWLEDFSESSMAAISVEHSTLLQRRFELELTRYEETLEAAARELGRSLSDRESRKICFQSHLHGPKSIRTAISAFNTAAHLCEEIDGLTVPVRLRSPRRLGELEKSRPIGSADPQKVLSAEQIAELEWALSRDLQRYNKARAIFQKKLGPLDLASRGQHTPGFDVKRYFGLNGFREHTTREIAALRGLSPSSFPGVPRRIKRFLSPRLGSEMTIKLLKLRSRFVALRAHNQLEEINSSRRFIRDVLCKVDLTVSDVKAACVERYFGLNGREIQSQKTIGHELDLPIHTVISNIHSRLSEVLVDALPIDCYEFVHDFATISLMR